MPDPGACGKAGVVPHIIEMQDQSGRDGSRVLFLEEIAESQAAVVGGKAAHLGVLSRIAGVRVPTGFCITTGAFDRIMKEASIDDRLDRLSCLAAEDRETIASLSEEIRRAVEAVAVPRDLADAITAALARLGANGAYAVRSSATAEDLPTASFAGQQDSYLNVEGTAAVLEHVRKCWASLFTERAVTYRLRNGFDHRKVHMAVLVQQMVRPYASGVLFTADPVTGHRKACSIEAVFGLGESLVSGLVNPDVYKLRDGAVIEKTIASEPTLTDAQAVRLGDLGRRIEAHFGRPQDIEWCLVEDAFHIVQTRPITTLFPIPARSDGDNHVYISVGHQQMMTDAMKPLGIAFWKLIAAGSMHDAGGRMFVDVTQALASPTSRRGLLALFRKSDPLIAGAVESIAERTDFLPAASDTAAAGPSRLIEGAPIEANPHLVTELIARAEASLATLKREIEGKSGIALLDFILTDIEETKRRLSDPQSTQAVMSGMRATWWLNEQLETWLGERNAADTLAQSVPHNVTSEMGLSLLDVADVIRPYPDVVAFLENLDDDAFLDAGFANGLGKLAGGPEARDALRAWLDRYGMRCPGEIDITRPRFRERPTMLLPTLVRNIKTFEPGTAARRFAHGRQQAAAKERDILERLRALPDGAQKAAEAKSMIDRVRTFMGYREYPKYGMVSRTFVYKQALLEEAERLVSAQILREKEDIFDLTFQELHDVVRTRAVDHQLIRERKDAFASFRALTPPRVLTSDGEAVSGTYRRDDLPPDALVGLAVSSGIIEGRARVILDMAQADLEPGDILVTTFTDPSWTPLFVAVRGLVTEVGGLMTHGAVIAREYGLPAVVGVEHATKRIRDGQRIRVNGTDGYVELLA
jgi:pyruvate,water dikinase